MDNDQYVTAAEYHNHLPHCRARRGPVFREAACNCDLSKKAPAVARSAEVTPKELPANPDLLALADRCRLEAFAECSLAEAVEGALRQAASLLSASAAREQQVRGLIERWREPVIGNGDYFVGIQGAMDACANELESALLKTDGGD